MATPSAHDAHHRNGTAHPPAVARPRADGPVLSSLQLARTPRAARRLAAGLVVLLLVLVPVLLLAPWTQTVHGTGRAIAFNPVQRPQVVVSPIQGRVRKWHVVEGDRVRAGQLLVDLVDNDPMILERLREQESLGLMRMSLAEGRIRDQDNRVRFIRDERELLLDEAQARIGQTQDMVLQILQEFQRANADLVADELQFNRQQALFTSKSGRIVAERDVEEARRRFELAKAQVSLVQARIDAAKKAQAGAEFHKQAVDKRTQASIQSEESALKSARSEQASVQQQYNTIRTTVERQENQRVYAPTDGTIFRVLANAEAGGALVNPGQQLATLVPDIRQVEPPPAAARDGLAGLGGGGAAAGVVALTAPDLPGITAELLIDGNDLPLVRKGDRALVQFEGWAAVQFAAYPEAATGTFEGRVYLVDPTSDGQGRFRILVEPAAADPTGKPAQPWPAADYLRQGVRAQGWVLAQNVTVGYELWRLLNGFPPAREVKPKDARSPLGPVTGLGGKK